MKTQHKTNYCAKYPMQSAPAARLFSMQTGVKAVSTRRQDMPILSPPMKKEFSRSCKNGCLKFCRRQSFVGEEEDIHASIAKGYAFIVDPIDGTDQSLSRTIM